MCQMGVLTLPSSSRTGQAGSEAVSAQPTVATSDPHCKGQYRAADYWDCAVQPSDCSVSTLTVLVDTNIRYITVVLLCSLLRPLIRIVNILHVWWKTQLGNSSERTIDERVLVLK